jgi:hypothetical protein
MQSILDVASKEIFEDKVNFSESDTNIYPSTIEILEVTYSKGAGANFYRQVLGPMILAPESLNLINWLKSRNLLANRIDCEICGEMMVWSVCNSVSDGFLCRCSFCKTSKSIIYGSFFYKSCLTTQKLVHLMYLWFTNTSEENTVRESGVSKSTIVLCFKMFRQICASHFESLWKERQHDNIFLS